MVVSLQPQFIVLYLRWREEEIPNRQDLLRHARLNCGTNLSSLWSAAFPPLPSLNLGSAAREILAYPRTRKLLDKRIDVRLKGEERRDDSGGIPGPVNFPASECSGGKEKLSLSFSLFLFFFSFFLSPLLFPFTGQNLYM